MSNPHGPSVSVVLCTYNGARFLDEQLASVTAQTYAPCEILVHDDGSTDATPDIVARWSRQDPRIRFVRNDGPHGVNGNFFTAMRRASGELLALCDQDDIWEPDKLAVQVEALGDDWLCSGFSRPFSEGGYPALWDARRPNYHLLRVLYLGVLPGHTLLLRRSLLRYLPQGISSPYLYDWQLQTVAAAAGKIVFVDHVLVNWRRHAGAATAVPPVERGQLRSVLRYVCVTLFRHRRLQRAVRARFAYIGGMLAPLPFDTPQLADARRMAALQQSRRFSDFLRLTVFCIRHRRHLFHTETTGRAWLDILRAAYFPFSCGWYYRGVLRPPRTPRP